MKRILRVVGWVLLGIVIVAVAAFAWLDRPLGAGELRSHPAPLTSYSAALARIRMTSAEESRLPLQAVGHSIALVHGSQTETAVVIVHGYTHMPTQFRLIAKGYYDSGANVWVPRMPYHGYANRMTPDLANLTPEQLAAFTDSAVDVAHGLGRHVVIIGLSGGGTISTWAAAERPDVSQAVVLSPLLLPKGMQPWTVLPFARALMTIPNIFEWWDAKLKVKAPGPAYPRFATRGIGSFLLLGQRALADTASGAHPAKGNIVLLANLGDQSIDPRYAISVEQRVAAPARLRMVVIPASAHVLHDIVNTLGENRKRIRECYAYISRAAGVRMPDPLTGR